MLLTSEDYTENSKMFKTRRGPERSAAVVLVGQIWARRVYSVHPMSHTGTLTKNSIFLQDVFAGIGSGVISLKRLGIDMKTIIHVEHDKIATHGTLHCWARVSMYSVYYWLLIPWRA